MKDKAPIIVLIIVAAGLGLGLIVVNNKARQEKQDLYDKLTIQSNNVTAIKTSLTEQQAVNQVLETNLAAMRVDYSNKLVLSDSNMRSAQENLDRVTAESKAQADALSAEIAQRDKKISDLESQNQDLDKQSANLRDHISGLQTQIAATQDKLARSEGDRKVLLVELRRLQAEETVWENRFNDLAVLRAQVRKLREEMSQARTLDWIRRGIYDTLHEKGGERLVHPEYNSAPSTNLTLNLDLHRPAQTNFLAPPPDYVPAK